MSEAQEKGRLFEALVGRLLRATCGGEAVVEMARLDNWEAPIHRGDRGRDFQVIGPNASGQQQLFGEPIFAGRKYYVEAKYVSDGPLDYAPVSVNLSRVQNDDIDGIFIVTNSHLRPSAYFDLINAFRTLKNKIIIVDGAALREWCIQANIVWSNDIEVLKPNSEHLIDGITIHTYMQPTRIRGEAVQFFYMVFYNRNNEGKTIEVFTPSDVDWLFTDRTDLHHTDPTQQLLELDIVGTFCRTLIVQPWHSRELRLCGVFRPDAPDNGIIRRRAHGRHDEGARIVARVGDDIIPLFRNLRPIKVCFRSPFTGARNKRLRDNLKPIFDDISNLRDSPTIRIIHIEGEAGVGKSRLVDEILPFSSRSDFVVIHHTVSAGGESDSGHRSYWSYVQAQLVELVGAGYKPEWLGAVKDAPSLLEAIVSNVQSKNKYDRWSAAVLVIEDLHRASEYLCRKIRSVIERDRSLNTNVILILTARNDDTYVNPAYRELSGILRDGALKLGQNVTPVLSRVVRQLEVGEARTLVSDIIEGIQETGIDRILTLSGATPQHIIQCIEYLLDESLVAITGRDTLSIIDQRNFEVRSAKLPETMHELFALRFNNLGLWEDRLGEAAQAALLAASVFGTRFPRTVCSLVPGVDENVISAELIARRFFKQDSSGDREELRWHHENLLLFFNYHRRTRSQVLAGGVVLEPIAERFVENSHIIRHNKQVWRALHPLAQADIAVLIGERDTAVDRFTPLFSHIRSIETFNTLDASTDYFEHIEYAVELLNGSRENRDNELLWKLLALKAYIGAYHKGLRYELDAFAYGMKVLPVLDLPTSTAKRCRMWLQTIDAQAHLDSGFTGQALERYMNLIHVLRLADLTAGGEKDHHTIDWDVAFDIHNSLRLLFTYSNFQELARVNGELAAHCVLASGVESIVDVDLGDRALFYLLTDRRRCIALLEAALKLNEVQGVERHKWHSSVSLIANTIPDNLGNIAWIAQKAIEAERIIATCLEAKYHSILPRIYLLRAVLEYLMGCNCVNETRKQNHFENALFIAYQGLNTCEAYSIGFISWQLRNLRAVIEARRRRWKTATQELLTAVALIEKEGLTFIGRDGVISAVPIVLANCLSLAADRLSDRRILELLGKLHGFEPYQWNTTTHLKEARRLAQKYHHIIPGYEHNPDGLIVDYETDLAVVVWF